MEKLVFVLWFSFVQLIVCDEAAEKNKVFTECATELSISADLPHHFREHGELPENADEKAKCFFHCVGKKFGLNGESDTINKEKAIEWMTSHHPVVDKEKISSTMNSCAERSEADVCDRWYQFSKCLFKELTPPKEDDEE